LPHFIQHDISAETLREMGLPPVDASKVAWAPAEDPDDLLD
jgi:hypothetical protein